MNKIRHFAVGLLIFAVVIGLTLVTYNDLQDSYGWSEADNQTVNTSGGIVTSNIADALNNMLIINSTTTINKAMLTLGNPTGSPFDIMGAIFSGALGIIGTVLGIMTFPFEIGYIIGSFYGGEIPGLITGVIIQVITVYLAFILISAQLRHDI